MHSSLTAILPRKCDDTDQNLINNVYIVIQYLLQIFYPKNKKTQNRTVRTRFLSEE